MRLSDRKSVRAISIHALVKRATDTLTDRVYSVDISIHALVKRATPTALKFVTYVLDFNPRPREEGDGGRNGKDW